MSECKVNKYRYLASFLFVIIYFAESSIFKHWGRKPEKRVVTDQGKERSFRSR